METWRVPVRIDFAGGTLDLWPIYAMVGGCITVNAAVDLWVEIEVQRGGAGHHLQSRDLGLDYHFEAWPEAPPQGLSWVWRVLDASSVPPARVRLHSPVPRPGRLLLSGRGVAGGRPEPGSRSSSCLQSATDAGLGK